MGRGHLSVVVVSVGLLVVGCGDHEMPSPTAPTSNAPAPPVVPLPPPTRTPPSFSQRIDLGENVQSRVTSDDPVCAQGWPYRCRYYGLTMPRSGWLNVTIAWNPRLANPYPFDMGIIDEQGREWGATAGQPAERGLAIMATAGATYVIEVWSFVSPDEEFELKTSLFVP